MNQNSIIHKPWLLGLSIASLLLCASILTTWKSTVDGKFQPNLNILATNRFLPAVQWLGFTGNDSRRGNFADARLVSDDLRKILRAECQRNHALNGSFEEVSSTAIQNLERSLNASRQESRELQEKLNEAMEKLKNLERMSDAVRGVLEKDIPEVNSSLSSSSEDSKSYEILDQAVEKVITELQRIRADSWAKDAKIAQLEVAAKSTFSWERQLGHGHFNLSKPHPIMAPLPASWKQRSFAPHGYFGFIQYSAYRMGPKKVNVVGMVDRRTMRFQKVNNCSWHGNDGQVIHGGLRYIYENHHENKRYTSQVMWCDLERETGSSGGFLLGLVNEEEMVLFSEDPGQPQGPVKEFEFELTFCSPPLHGRAQSERVREWVDFHHHYAGVNHFTLYNVNSMDEALRSQLEPYFKAGMVDLVEVENMLAFDFFYFGQMLFIYDCAYSMALRSRWVFFLDFDEYLQAMPPHSVNSILSQYQNATWLSHGSIWWDTSKCLKGGGGGANSKFAVEKMVIRSPKLHCQNPNQNSTKNGEFCLTWEGHRKLIVNPRKVYMVQVHAVIFGDGKGVDLSATREMRHNHFRGLNVLPFQKGHCKTEVNDSMAEGDFIGREDWLQVRDDSLARIVRSFPGRAN